MSGPEIDSLSGPEIDSLSGPVTDSLSGVTDSHPHSRWVNVPGPAREAIHKEALRRNQGAESREQEVRAVAKVVRKNQHVVSYVDVMRNYSEDLVRKKKEEEEKREEQWEEARRRQTSFSPLPASSVFPPEAVCDPAPTDLEVSSEEIIKGVMLKGIIKGTPQTKTKSKSRPKSAGNPFEKRTAPGPPQVMSEPKTKPKSKTMKSKHSVQ